MSDFIIRPYQKGDEIEINDSFNHVFGTNRSIEEWNWKFQPENDCSVIMIAIDKGGKVLAQYAAIKVLVQIDGKIETHLLVVDSYSLKTREVLRKRVFLKTYEEYCDNFGGRPPEKFPWHFGSNTGRIQKLNKLRMHSTDPVPIPYLFQETNKLLRPVGMLLGPLIWKWRVNRAKEIDLQDVNDLWRRSYERYPVAVVRDGNYIKRRYLSHPSNKYILLPVYDKGLMRGLGVIILSNRLMKWVDLLWDGIDPETIRTLKRLVWDLTLQTGAIKLEMWLSNDERTKDILIEEGMIIGNNPYDLYLTSRSFVPDIDGYDLTKRLYCTMSDSDLF